MSVSIPVRARHAKGGRLLNPALVPTPLTTKDEQPVIRIEAAVERPGRSRRVVGSILALAARLAWLRLTGRLVPAELGRQLTSFCVRMGVLWVKVAQLLSMRVDLLPPEVIDELAKLQDRASGVPGEVAIRTIEEDLGVPIGHHFAEFDPAPFAAASIAQVHRARLKSDGVVVAVKVRRPGVEEAFAADRRVLRGIVWLLEALSIKDHAGWDELLWEAEQIIAEELDYLVEASNQRRLRRSLRRHDVYVPKVFTRYCSSRVLVMEFVPGVLMSDYLRVARTDRSRLDAWHSENDVDPVATGNRLLTSYLRQLLEDNLFHSDLHPGNLMLLRHGRLAFLDFGSLGTTEREFLRRYELFVESLVSGRQATAVDVFLLFARHLPSVEMGGIKQELVEAIQGWLRRSSATGLPYEQRSASVLTDSLVRILDSHGITATWAFMRIARAWTTMDASLRELAPRQDWRPVMARYFRRKERRAGPKALRTLMAAGGNTSPLDVPRMLYEQGIFRGTIVRRMAQVFEGSTTVASDLVARVFRWVGRAHVAAFTVLLLAVVVQHGSRWGAGAGQGTWVRWIHDVPRLDIQVWLLAAVVLAYGWRSSRRLQRRFSARLVAGEQG